MGKVVIHYVEKDGLLYPLISTGRDAELSAVGKYGLLWLSFMKENHRERFRTLTRLGCVNREAVSVNEEAFEMLETIMDKHIKKHPLDNPNSTMEMWKIREQAKTLAEEVVLNDIVYRYHRFPLTMAGVPLKLQVLYLKMELRNYRPCRQPRIMYWSTKAGFMLSVRAEWESRKPRQRMTTIICLQMIR